MNWLINLFTVTVMTVQSFFRLYQSMNNSQIV